MSNSMYWKKKRRQFLAAIFGLVVGASIPAYIDTHPREYQDMLKWLRNKFGKCKDRWTHDWKVSKQGVDVELNDSRTCTVCGCHQVCIGHHSFMDADPIPQWKDCPHDYDESESEVSVFQVVQAGGTTPIRSRICRKCKVVEVNLPQLLRSGHVVNVWRKADLRSYLVVPKPTKAKRVKHRSIDD
jgi:hypothetical protein